MEKIKKYIDTIVSQYKDVKNDMENYFFKYNFEDFLSTKAEKYYKTDELYSFFSNIQLYIADITKEELVEYLETTKKGFEKARLTNNPINFSTNPMTNMVRLWNFEVYAELIKQIDIILCRYC